jgi:hypothetical protein
MQINCFIWIADKPMGDDESALGAIMELNKIIWILDTPTERADQSAVCEIHRPLHCHPE